MKNSIYLDFAAATPVASEVLAAMKPFFSDNFYNPSASYLSAKGAKRALEQARATVARNLGARSTEIIFTAGATEADNLAIHGVMRQFPKANVVVSTIEHEAVLVPASQYDRRLAKIESDGRINLKDLADKIDENTVLVSVMLANNEIGTIEPIREISRLVAEERVRRQKSGNKLPIYLHSDAAQASNYLDLHVSRLGVDLLTLNGGKIYGPKQSGCLFVKTGTQLVPLISGGGQERDLRSGTENVPYCVGFAMALGLAQASRESERARLAELQNYFFAELAKLIPSTIINGSLKHRLPNNLHFTIPGQDNERLIFALDEAGVMAAAGSACSAANDESSHVLKAIGLDDASARASLRLTMGRSTTKQQLNYVLETLVAILNNRRG